MKSKILNINVNVLKMNEAVEKGICFLNTQEHNYIVTPNPEMCVVAKKNKKFQNILNSADLVLPDGIGVVFASRLNKNKIEDRVTGVDFVKNLLYTHNKSVLKVYLLGGESGVCEKAKINIEKAYKNVEVVGISNGFFNEEDEKKIIEHINEKSPDLLLVGLGMVKQENFIFRNKNQLNCKLSIGVGGTIDVLAGIVNRAPSIYIKLNIEWLYRLLKQPKRFVRTLSIPKFIILVVAEKFGGSNEQRRNN